MIHNHNLLLLLCRFLQSLLRLLQRGLFVSQRLGLFLGVDLQLANALTQRYTLIFGILQLIESKHTTAKRQTK